MRHRLGVPLVLVVLAPRLIAARMAAWSGIPTVIASAADPAAVAKAWPVSRSGRSWGHASTKLSARKLWIAFGMPGAAQVIVDQGAATPCSRKVARYWP